MGLNCAWAIGLEPRLIPAVTFTKGSFGPGRQKDVWFKRGSKDQEFFDLGLRDLTWWGETRQDRGLPWVQSQCDFSWPNFGFPLYYLGGTWLYFGKTDKYIWSYLDPAGYLFLISLPVLTWCRTNQLCQILIRWQTPSSFLDCKRTTFFRGWTHSGEASRFRTQGLPRCSWSSSPESTWRTTLTSSTRALTSFKGCPCTTSLFTVPKRYAIEHFMKCFSSDRALRSVTLWAI